MLKLNPVPAFNDNYIWIISHEETAEQGVIVVDPGSAPEVQEWLNHHNQSIVAILITHHHADHTGGVTELQRDNNFCPIYGPANSPFKDITQPVSDGDIVHISGLSFKVKAVPGHTLDHISYFCEDESPFLLCGDTLFLAGCGRLFEGTAEQMLAAMDYFASLPDDTRVYCAHEYSLSNLAFALEVEPENETVRLMIEKCNAYRSESLPTLPSRIDLEKAINPFMRTREEAVINKFLEKTGSLPASPTACLQFLREWKNNF